MILNIGLIGFFKSAAGAAGVSLLIVQFPNRKEDEKRVNMPINLGKKKEINYAY
jgi:hypothetical protein